MTRRLKPPMHPVTGHPHVDNALRNAWRGYRDYLRAMPWLPGGHTQPRKTKKKAVRGFYKTGFIYHAPAYYVPAFLREIGATHEQD